MRHFSLCRIWVNNTYVPKTAKFYMLIFKVDKFYFENPKLSKKWKYFKQGNLTSNRVSAEPLELPQNMLESMAILEFHDTSELYSDVVLPYEQGCLMNFSELYDLWNVYVPRETILSILDFSTYQVVHLTGVIYWRDISIEK